jgi:hypothetical protein
MSDRVLSDTIIRVVAKDPATCVELELAAQEVGARVRRDPKLPKCIVCAF